MSGGWQRFDPYTSEEIAEVVARLDSDYGPADAAGRYAQAWLDVARLLATLATMHPPISVEHADSPSIVALANEAFATAADGIRGGVPDAGREQCAREWAAQQVGYYARSWFNDEVGRLAAAQPGPSGPEVLERQRARASLLRDLVLEARYERGRLTKVTVEDYELILRALAEDDRLAADQNRRLERIALAHLRDRRAPAARKRRRARTGG